MRVAAILMLLILAGPALVAMVSLVPEAPAEECSRDRCPVETPLEHCPPLCTHCPGCCVPQILLPDSCANILALGSTQPLLHRNDALRVPIRADEIFHVPKLAA